MRSMFILYKIKKQHKKNYLKKLKVSIYNKFGNNIPRNHFGDVIMPSANNRFKKDSRALPQDKFFIDRDFKFPIPQSFLKPRLIKQKATNFFNKLPFKKPKKTKARYFYIRPVSL